MIARAYSIGVFPMARRRSDTNVHWVAPTYRGILPLDRFHVPRRLKKTIRQTPFEIRCDTAFEAVVRACAAPRESSNETWINAEILRVFCELHQLGQAHSVEAWRDGCLVGGLYGLGLGGAFFGESMFSLETDASKIALVHLAALLRLGRFSLLDIQFVTDHLCQFGAQEIINADYLQLLENALVRQAVFYSDLPADALRSAVEVVLTQSSTQTS